LAGEPLRERGGGRRGPGRALRAGFDGPARLGDAADERARPRGGETGREALPVDVGDGGERQAVLDRPARGVDGGLRAQRADAEPAQPLPFGAGGGRTALPRAPGDGGGGKARGAHLLGERVDGRGPGGVSTLSGPAPEPDDGR